MHVVLLTDVAVCRSKLLINNKHGNKHNQLPFKFYCAQRRPSDVRFVAQCGPRHNVDAILLTWIETR